MGSQEKLVVEGDVGEVLLGRSWQVLLFLGVPCAWAIQAMALWGELFRRAPLCRGGGRLLGFGSWPEGLFSVAEAPQAQAAVTLRAGV